MRKRKRKRKKVVLSDPLIYSDIGHRGIIFTSFTNENRQKSAEFRSGLRSIWLTKYSHN